MRKVSGLIKSLNPRNFLNFIEVYKTFDMWYNMAMSKETLITVKRFFLTVLPPIFGAICGWGIGVLSKVEHPLASFAVGFSVVSLIVCMLHAINEPNRRYRG